jgi:MFS family permease
MTMLLIVFLGYFGMTIPYSIIPVYILNSFIHYPLGFFKASLLLSSYPFGLFIGSFLIGYLSDKVGRKKVLLISLSGAAISYFFTGLAIRFNLSVLFILLRFITGLLEGNISIARAVIVESSNTKLQIYKGFGWVNAALTLSWVLGPLLGAYFFNLSHHNFSAVFYVSSVANIVAIVFVLKLKLDNKKGYIEHMAFSSSSLIGTQLRLFLFLFIAGLAVDGVYQFLPLYIVAVKEANAFSLAKVLALIALSNMTVNLFINELLLKSIGEFFTLLIGSISFAIALLIILSHHDFNVICILVLGASIALIITNAQALVSSYTRQHSQGKLMGLITSSRMLGCGAMSFCQTNLARISYDLPFILSISLIIIANLLIITAKFALSYGDDQG